MEPIKLVGTPGVIRRCRNISIFLQDYVSRSDEYVYEFWIQDYTLPAIHYIPQLR